jgi:hypothetical protein
MYSRLLVVVIMLAATLFSSAGRAAIITLTGTTTGDPTFNRPVEDFSALSGVGTNVAYDGIPFSVSASGEYSFLTTGNFDILSYLYSPSLNVLSPLSNGLVANDDLVSFTTSGFAFNLLAGTDYLLVTTSFENSVAGSFSTTIGGPGTIVTAAPGGGLTSPNIVTLTGTTSGDPTFNRPVEDFSALSGVGTNVAYDGIPFSVSASGEYSFLTTGEVDILSYLYSPSLNVLNPLSNGLVANDDLVSLSTSGFAFNLLAGTDYLLVTTSFENSVAGSFSTTIGGPGTIITASNPNPNPIPEPQTYGLMLAALGVLGLLKRRRKLGPASPAGVRS